MLSPLYVAVTLLMPGANVPAGTLKLAIAMEFPEASMAGCTGALPSVTPFVESVKTTFPVGELAVLCVLMVRLKVTVSLLASVFRLAVSVEAVAA